MLFGRAKDSFTYEIIDGKAVLTRFSGRGPQVEVDSVYEGRPVEEIGENAFYDNGKIETVLLPESVRKIGDGAFRGCSALKSISLPTALEELGEYCFAGCKSLTEIHLPSTVTAIPEGAFQKCRCLTRAVLPESVVSIGREAYADCRALELLRMGKGVTNVGENAFKGTGSALCAVISEGVDSKIFGEAAALYRRGEDGLTLVSYGGHDTKLTLDSEICGESVTAIGDRVFAMFAYLESVALPAKLKRIGESAFAGCSALDAIALPETLEVIGAKAFSGCGTQEGRPSYVSARAGDMLSCSGLDFLRLPAGVKEVGPGAFAGCTDLKQVVIEGADTHLSAGCFAYCPFTSFTFPAHTEEIQGEVLRGCALLENVVIPEGVEMIFERAFEGCASLKEIRLPSTLRGIAEGAFSGCASLKTVEIPSSVTEIQPDAFSFMESLTEIRVDLRGEAFRVEDGLLIENATGRLLCAVPALSGTVYVPADVKIVAPCAFTLCGAEKIVLPEAVTEIGDWAFRFAALKTLQVDSPEIKVGNGVLLDTEDVEIIANETVTAALNGISCGEDEEE